MVKVVRAGNERVIEVRLRREVGTGGGAALSLPARQTFAFLFHLADMFQLRLTGLHLALTVAHYPGLSSHL